MEKVILVDENDREIGLMEKMEAHQKGFLHRAFSIFIFNEEGQLLLQQRALDKYHSGGLWTNTCCSHPRDQEDIVEAGVRRLQEEMGFTTQLKPVFSFIYKAKLDNDLTEHELDHVLIGTYSADPSPNSGEVGGWKYVALDFLKNDIVENPQQYTVWFLEIFDRVKDHFLTEKN